MTAAMADMHDDTREAERCFDKEFGYADEDPIERHVKLHLTPPKAQLAKHGYKAEQQRLEVEEVLIQPMMENEDSDPPIFRPGLIQFQRTHSSSRRSLPSFGGSNESASTGETTSNASTPFGNGTDTPGSAFSEASFEVIKPEDVYSLYGPRYQSTISASAALGVVGPDRHSHWSTYSSFSTSSTATDSTVRAARPTMGRQRSRQNPYAREKEGDLGKLGAGSMEEDNDWLNGRTVSERMIAQAGISCQRGRANR